MKYFAFFAALLVFLTPVKAQIHQARGQFVINYKDALGTFDRKQVPASVKQKAQQEAMLKAVEAYFAEAGQAEAASFDSIRAKVLAEPGRYILDSVVLSEDDNTKDLKYSVVVRASLNVANLRNAMQSSSAIGKAAESEKSAMSFVFVSREMASMKSFDDRVYKRADASVQVTANASQSGKSTVKEKTSEGESIKKGQIETSGSRTDEVDVAVASKAGTTSTAIVETGGSITRKASETSWRILPSANLNQVFVSAFSQAGYDVIEGAMVETDKFKIAAIEADYQSGNDLQPQTLRNIAAAMKQSEIPLVALGTLDVGLAEKDPQTGLQRVAVTVNAKLWDVTRPIPRTRAAVGPIVYAGVGPTEAEARANALKSAASNAAQELSTRLANLGVR
ncbi:hypothetical protein EDC62_0937 [Tibeticola sediminis]|uniref:LPP20 lipoprotein n=1 Tax=Tibeticola sediminis TaxID=1917811 RepID=A0A3N4UR96_9BURK|nr:hypothetical protein [Tibeticola sediminis]RPE73226.1 hypothetical protein EDC62_0937 [Tibeticola sediminis]